MRIQPRGQLLEIWEAVARHGFVDGEWRWEDADGPSSVADAERLLCLLYPATEAAAFRLDDPDMFDRDVLSALHRIGGRGEIPVKLIQVLQEFTDKHRDDDGGATFAGGRYFRPADPSDELTAEQRELDVVDSYSMSVTLGLATLGFLKVFTAKPRRAGVTERAEALRVATSARLTSAMVGLLRSFTVDVFDVDSARGRALTHLVTRGRPGDRTLMRQFRHRMRPLRAAIRDRLVLGLDVLGVLDDEDQLFECGWAWGVVRDAPWVETGEAVGRQPGGVAAPAPDLTFTVVALDGIVDLFSERTLTLGLLDAEQQRLAEALRLRRQITRQYWSTVARFGEGTWPLEDIPWRTAGERESEYFSLSVAAILVQDLTRGPADADEIARLTGVLERLADRGRVTCRETVGDPAVALHNPGLRIPLPGSECLGPKMEWSLTAFSAQLLKQTVQLCALSRDSGSHDRLLRLAEQILESLWRRRIGAGPGQRLWDDVHAVHVDSPKVEEPLSWSITERTVESLVAAHRLYERPPIRSPQVADLATALLGEAEHLFGCELMEPASTGGGSRELSLKQVEVGLRRARGLLADRPGTACALALRALAELDQLAFGRGAAAREV